MKRLISIIVPVYNVESYLERCLESLKRQWYDNLEIILVDDGSTDNSGKICDDFAKREKRAKVFHKRNGGLSDARNYGLKKAVGEMLAFVDSDDYIDESYISDMYYEMRHSDADIVVCGFNNNVPRSEILSGKDATIRLLTRQENLEIVAWNKLYKKELFIDNDIWFPKGKKNEDSLTIYKVLSKAKKVAYLDKSLYSYVDRDESIMNTGRIQDRLAMRELAAREAIEYFKDNDDLLSAARISLLLAEFAYLDFAIGKKNDWRFGHHAKKWIKTHSEEYKRNSYLTAKLKLYYFLLSIGLYEAFRKIRHE